MKSLLLALSMFFVVNANAGEYGFSVDQILCGEIDPFVVGDACVVELSHKQKKLALVVDFDAFQANFATEAESYADQVMMVQMHKLKKVSWDTVKVLREDLGIKKDVVIRSATINDLAAYPID